MKSIDIIKELLKSQRVDISSNDRVLIADGYYEWYFVYRSAKEDEPDFEAEERIKNPLYSGSSFKDALKVLGEGILNIKDVGNE